MRYAGDKKLTVDKRKKNCMLFEAKTLRDDLATSGEQRCLNSTHSPWKDVECGLPRPHPQVKRIGLTNVVYCRGHTIVIESMSEQNCPNYAFILSIKQSFRTEKFVFTSTVTDLQVRQTPSTSVSQQEVNAQLLPGINPYHVEKDDFELTLTGVSTSVKRVWSNYSDIITFGTLILVIIAALLFFFRYMKTNSTKDVIRQVP